MSINKHFSENNPAKKDENKGPDYSQYTAPNTGTQGSNISGSATKEPPKAPTKQSKSGSGMFTNLQSYVERNKQGAQRMGQNLQGNVAQQNQNIQNAIQKQKTDFMSRVNQNRTRLDEASKFGKETFDKAQNYVDPTQLQNQYNQKQKELQQVGSVNNQYITDYNTYKQGFQQGDNTGTAKEFDKWYIDNYTYTTPQDNKTYLKAVQDYKDYDRFEKIKSNIQGELDSLQSKIDNAPEELTKDEINRYNALRQGKERFDRDSLNLTRQADQVQELRSQADALNTAQGRRELMRKQFGSKGGYGAGLAGLDNLLITGNRQIMNDLVTNAQAQAKGAEASLQKAVDEGRMTQDEMRIQSENLRKNLQKQVDEAQVALESDLTSRAETGEGTMLKQLKDKIESGQGLSAEEMSILGISEDDFLVDIPQNMLRDIQIDPETFSIQDVATSQDLAKAGALASLAGGEADDYLLNNLGLEQDQLDRIKSRGLMEEGDEFLTNYDELSQADRNTLEAIRSNVKQQQDQVRREKSKIDSLRRQAAEFKAKRDHQAAIGGAHNQHWKYYNHYYATLSQEANKLTKNFMNKYNSQNKMLERQSSTKEQALQDFLNKFRQR